MLYCPLTIKMDYQENYAGPLQNKPLDSQKVLLPICLDKLAGSLFRRTIKRSDRDGSLINRTTTKNPPMRKHSLLILG